jgi:hypothetical protein
LAAKTFLEPGLAPAGRARSEAARVLPLSPAIKHIILLLARRAADEWLQADHGRPEVPANAGFRRASHERAQAEPVTGISGDRNASPIFSEDPR